MSKSLPQSQKDRTQSEDGFGLSLVKKAYRLATGDRRQQWGRVVMDEQTKSYVDALDYNKLEALEISGNKWEHTRFKSYHSANYPEYDVCNGPFGHAKYDIVIAEQVFEHLKWPYRAARHVFEMLRPGGHFIVTTPFLIRIHNHPVDCTRWSEVGLKYFLAEAGFDLDAIRTGSWGNRKCVTANFRQWAPWRPWLHSLKNEPDFPVHVWAFAQRK